MKKNYLLATALAIMTMASCSDNDFIGGQEALNANESGAISFNLNTPAVTRAGGAEAATALNNKFIVYGEKGETSKSKYGDGKLVFPNYTVEYTANTAYKTTSNTKNWEYVGVSPISQDYVKMYDGTSTTNVTADAQTIKYWDYSAASYTFTAISALPADISGNKVVVQKNTTGADNVYQKGYTLTIGSGASLDKLYLADRVNILQSTAGSDRTVTNAYGGNVTFNFRNILSHVRVGIYETIPGYDVSAISFKVTGDNAAKNGSSQDAFGAICPNIAATGFTGTLTVTYGDGATDIENRPIILAGTPESPTAAATDLILGTNINSISTSTLLNKTAASPTWDTSDGSDGGLYTSVIPLTHSTNLKLKCTYTLYNNVTKETITVTDATAEIPFKYLQWKPNYKYTYIFKISDNTNGKTNPSLGPAGLYPITFDATETVAEDGQAEYITTISEPSITTFGVKSSKYTHDKEQYEAGSDIYVTFMDGSSLVETITLGDNVNVYLATTSNATTYPITEASVAESIAEISAKTKQVTVVNKNADGSTCFSAEPAKATEVPGEDGTCLSTPVVVAASSVTDATGYYTDKACTVAATLTDSYLAAGTYFQKWNSALKLTGVKATTATTALVVEYVKTPATYTGQEVIIADATAFTAAKTALNLYTDSGCTTPVGDAAFSAEAHYYKKVVDSPGVYAYKVINVQ